MKIFNSFGIFLIVFSTILSARAQQIKGKTEINANFRTQIEAGKICAELKPGKIVAFAQPEYPDAAKAARVGGTVRVDLKLDEKGAFAEILGVSGNDLLQVAARAAARRVKFSPPVCDNVPVSSAVVLLYNFIPFAARESYFTTRKIEEFADVKTASEFYEPILNLTENYGLAFGYADKKFYADAPLTRGDFAEFLRRTLDLLAERAQASGKLPREIGLFYSLNAQNLKSADKITDLDKRDAYYESEKILLLTYDIALTNDKLEFSGKKALTRGETIDLWTRIFGAEAVPVNFAAEKSGVDDARIMTRGEFALFLQESLGVLTYKVLS